MNKKQKILLAIAPLALLSTTAFAANATSTEATTKAMPMTAKKSVHRIVKKRKMTLTCVDGTKTTVLNIRGACSSHGGVKK